ncbi:GNAT family N-acetyltransferase [Picosynechococcus sp. PCC 7002]|uniref:GNAT family N-acetyltransferase n=1 Tax=Picosynechococcus sp. (strain ATCC 27264 / PCC 7002 / PR-6) TaxID=32049 RepID=UPI001C3DE2EE|nr:GNAT family N-acetyltransferase [Picosynechococcus sp. PCC 7002]
MLATWDDFILTLKENKRREVKKEEVLGQERRKVNKKKDKGDESHPHFSLSLFMIIYWN